MNEFGDKVSTLAQAITSQVQLAYRGELAAGSALTEDDKKRAKNGGRKKTKVKSKKMPHYWAKQNAVGIFGRCKGNDRTAGFQSLDQ